MNLLLLERRELRDDGEAKVGGRRLRHLLEVHRAGVGDTLRVGVIDGAMGTATIEALDENAARLSVQLDRQPPAKLPVSLALALPRPKMLRRILRSVAEYGVRELHLVNSYRVEKSYWQSPVLQPDSVRDYLLLGLEQAGDTVLPVVHQHRRFKPWVEDTLPALLRDRQGLLSHPGDYPPCPRELESETLFIIGPEGGFIPYEVEKLQQAGCTTVSLGARILRVENAVSSVLGRIS